MEQGQSYRHRSLALGNRRGLTRRQAIGAALGGSVGLAAALAGCRREERPAATTSTKEPKRGGTLTLRGGTELEGRTFDPHINPPQATAAHRLWAQGLVLYNLETYLVEPDLAQTWETLSPTELVFRLHPGVRWHNKPPVNGRLLTAQDVVFSLERIRSPDPKFVSKSLLDTVDTIEAVDQATIRLKLKEVDASLLSKLADDTMLVLAPEVVERARNFATAEEVVGTGAFIMTTLQEKVAAEYVRNPDYWKPGLPYLDRINTRFFADDQTTWAAFLAGQIDIAGVPGTEAKRYLAQQGPDYTPLWAPYNGFIVAYPNTKARPMDDPRVTRALRLLIDHEEFIKSWSDVFHGRGRNVFLFPPALHVWDLKHEEYSNFLYWKQPKDDAVKLALELLSAAGFSRSNPVRFVMNSFDTEPNLNAAQLLQAQWRRLSQGVVEAELKPTDAPTRSRLQAQREFTYMYAGGLGATTDPDITLTRGYRSDGSRNYVGFADPKADELIDKQRRTFKLEERKAIVREFILYMIDRYPGAYPAGYFTLNATRPQVRGFQAEPYRIHGKQYERVWLDT